MASMRASIASSSAPRRSDFVELFFFIHIQVRAPQRRAVGSGSKQVGTEINIRFGIRNKWTGYVIGVRA